MKIIILEFESERISMIERALEHHHKKLKKLELEPDIVKGSDLIKRDLQKNIEVIKLSNRSYSYFQIQTPDMSYKGIIHYFFVLL